MWVKLIEHMFSLHRISDESTGVNLVLEALGTDLYELATEVLSADPIGDNYQLLKNQILVNLWFALAGSPCCQAKWNDNY